MSNELEVSIEFRGALCPECKAAIRLHVNTHPVAQETLAAFCETHGAHNKFALIGVIVSPKECVNGQEIQVSLNKINS